MKAVFIIMGAVVGVLSCSVGVYAQAVNDYRSATTNGAWNTLSSWERWNGSSWATPTGGEGTPSSSSGAITIRSGDSITVSAGVTVDEVTINAGGVVNLRQTLTVADGAGTDLTVNGTLENSNGSFAGAGTISFGSGGLYRHSRNDNAVPIATWNANSTCLITGRTSTDPSNLNQTFGNLTWNCPSQNNSADFDGSFTIQGNLSILSTGSSDLRITDGNVDRTLTVNGNFLLSGGTFVLNDGNSTTDVLMNVAGNFTQTGGTLTELSMGTSGIVFNGSGQQFFTFDSTSSNSIVSNTINFTVNNGSTLMMGDDPLGLGSDGAFTMGSSAGLGIGNSGGIAATGEASGNIRVTGTRTYVSGGTYIYNGSVAQVTGSGLPSTVTNLEINNSFAGSSVVLTNSVIVSSVLTMTNGNIDAGGVNVLTLGTSTLTLGTLVHTGPTSTVVGQFRRWIAAAATPNILFPVGTSSKYRPINLSFTGAPTTGGTITSMFVASDPGDNGLPLSENGVEVFDASSKGYWSLVSGDGLVGGTYSLDLTGTTFNITGEVSKVRIIKRANSAFSWTLNGTHVAGTGTIADPVGHRVGMSGFSQFTLAAAGDAPLPVELTSFTGVIDGRAARLQWKTASETSNLGFDILRSVVSASGQGQWDRIAFVPGHGTTAEPHNYAYTDDLSLLSGVSEVVYQLRQVDADGTPAFSQLLRLNVVNVRPGVTLDVGYPNPTNGEVTLSYTLTSKAQVRIELCDVLGKHISTMVDAEYPAGANSVMVNLGALPIPVGTYYFRLVAGSNTAVQPIVFAP